MDRQAFSPLGRAEIAAGDKGMRRIGLSINRISSFLSSLVTEWKYQKGVHTHLLLSPSSLSGDPSHHPPSPLPLGNSEMSDDVSEFCCLIIKRKSNVT